MGSSTSKNNYAQFCTKHVTGNVHKFVVGMETNRDLQAKFIVDLNNWLEDVYREERSKYLDAREMKAEKKRDNVWSTESYMKVICKIVRENTKTWSPTLIDSPKAQIDFKQKFTEWIGNYNVKKRGRPRAENGLAKKKQTIQKSKTSGFVVTIPDDCNEGINTMTADCTWEKYFSALNTPLVRDNIMKEWIKEDSSNFAYFNTFWITRSDHRKNKEYGEYEGTQEKAQVFFNEQVEKLESKFPYLSRYYVFDLAVGGGGRNTHYNVFIYDRETNTVEQYDPGYGSSQLVYPGGSDMQKIIKKVVETPTVYAHINARTMEELEDLEDLKSSSEIINPVEFKLFKPKFPAQNGDKDIFCQSWVLYFIYMRLVENKSLEEIEAVLNNNEDHIEIIKTFIRQTIVSGIPSVAHAITGGANPSITKKIISLLK